MWHCVICNKEVAGAWDDRAKKFYPASRYWKGSPEVFERVYCSPKCSQVDHKDDINGGNK